MLSCLFPLLLAIPRPTLAAPTPEEQALQAMLSGRESAAVGILERASSQHAELRWVAGMVALREGDYSRARRLLEADETTATWGRIELLHAEGKDVEASRLALEAMAQALGTEHADALAKMLISWAADRAEKDPANAARLLEAVLDFEVTATLRRQAEDALFALEGVEPSSTAVMAARKRLLSEPEDIGARRLWGMRLLNQDPARAWELLYPLLDKLPSQQALSLARELVKIELPSPWLLRVAHELLARFAEDEEVTRFSLETAKSVATRDPGRVDMAFEPLMKHPAIASEAEFERASATRDPSLRRSRLAEFAERKGASAQARSARELIRLSYQVQAESARTPEERIRVAREALAHPTSAIDTTLLYLAAPGEYRARDPEAPLRSLASSDPKGARLAELTKLAESFPGSGPWCAELAERVLEQGLDKARAESFVTTCSGAEGEAFRAIQALASGESFLYLRPTRGGLEVLAVGKEELRIDEHRVDPEVLFRSSEGHPLDTRLDAFLVHPDRERSMKLDPGLLKPILLRPESGGGLSALTLRLGDQRATALVPRDPLRISAIRQADELSLAIFSGEQPAGRCRVLVQDASGRVREAQTDVQGLLEMNELEGAIRVMASRGEALGWAQIQGESTRNEREDQLELVLPDRGIDPAGAITPVFLFGTTEEGDATGTLLLRSKADDGRTIEEREVTLLGGSARAELLVHGGGTLELWRKDERVLAQSVPAGRAPSEPSGSSSVKLRFSKPAPRPGDKLQVDVLLVGAVPPEGRAAELLLRTPWGERRESIRLGVEGASWPVDLRLARPGENIHVEVTFPGEIPVVADLSVLARDKVETPELPFLASKGEVIPVTRDPGSWLLADDFHGTALWFAPGEPLSLPHAGSWTIELWAEGVKGEGRRVRVLDERSQLDRGGVSKADAPLLAAHSTGGGLQPFLLRPGQRLPSLPPRGTRSQLVVMDTRDVPNNTDLLLLPLPEARAQNILVEGELLSKGPSTLKLGRDLPEGTHIWAFVRDASDAVSREQTLSIQPTIAREALEGILPWLPQGIEGEAIAAALLEEEQRLAEASDVKRVDFDFDPGREEAGMSMKGIGSMGYGGGGSAAGMGGGSFGQRGEGAIGSIRRPSFDPASVATLIDARPGDWNLEVHPWITMVSVDIITRSPEGRWQHEVRLLPVQGPKTPQPMEKPFQAPETWDGSLAGLVALLDDLPEDARQLALAAMIQAGHPELRPRLVVSTSQERGPGTSVARLLIPELPAPDAAVALARLEGLPDQRRVERAEAALLAAAGNPERATAAARRLLKEPELEDWIRTRAILALWVAGHQDEARQALSAMPAAALQSKLVKSFIDARTPAGELELLWSLARNAAAAPLDRALAISALARATGRPVHAFALPYSKTTLSTKLEVPLATFEGKTFSRGWSHSTEERPVGGLEGTERLVAGRSQALEVTLPAHPLPTRLSCPEDEGLSSRARWIDVPPGWAPRVVTCSLHLDRGTEASGKRVEITWFDTSGQILASSLADLPVDPYRGSAVTDPMSPDEQLELGSLLARRGDAGGMELLRSLLASSWLDPEGVSTSSEALLVGAMTQGSPALLISAFESYRERVPEGDLDLPTAAAVARAYASNQEPRRALEAVRVVIDARFREELGAVRVLEEGGLSFTALKLLKELLLRYPEVPTVIEARYLAPSMLLHRASSEGEDRLGYTRSSLRHTAAAELASFLLLHPDDPRAAEGSTLLLDTLEALGDPQRRAALAGPLFRRHIKSPQAWRLALADARARFADRDFSRALRVLDELEPPQEALSLVNLERGRNLEALGRLEEAREAYKSSARPEASSRLAWLDRRELKLPILVALRSDETPRIPSQLPAGSSIEVVAYAIDLQSLLLRDGGRLSPYEVHVDGLRAAGRARVRIGPDGSIPLPLSAQGAWLLTLTCEGQTWRSVAVRSDSELIVRPGTASDTLIQVRGKGGKALANAQIWSFDANGVYRTGSTDPLGAAWFEGGRGQLGVLAETGEGYVWWSPLGLNVIAEDWQRTVGAAGGGAAPRDDWDKLLENNAGAYETLFQQERKSSVRASML